MAIRLQCRRTFIELQESADAQPAIKRSNSLPSRLNDLKQEDASCEDESGYLDALADRLAQNEALRSKAAPKPSYAGPRTMGDLPSMAPNFRASTEGELPSMDFKRPGPLTAMQVASTRLSKGSVFTAESLPSLAGDQEDMRHPTVESFHTDSGNIEPSAFRGFTVDSLPAAGEVERSDSLPGGTEEGKHFIAEQKLGYTMESLPCIDEVDAYEAMSEDEMERPGAFQALPFDGVTFTNGSLPGMMKMDRGESFKVGGSSGSPSGPAASCGTGPSFGGFLGQPPPILEAQDLHPPESHEPQKVQAHEGRGLLLQQVSRLQPLHAQTQQRQQAFLAPQQGLQPQQPDTSPQQLQMQMAPQLPLSQPHGFQTQPPFQPLGMQQNSPQMAQFSSHPMPQPLNEPYTQDFQLQQPSPMHGMPPTQQLSQPAMQQPLPVASCAGGCGGMGAFGSGAGGPQLNVSLEQRTALIVYNWQASMESRDRALLQEAFAQCHRLAGQLSVLFIVVVEKRRTQWEPQTPPEDGELRVFQEDIGKLEIPIVCLVDGNIASLGVALLLECDMVITTQSSTFAPLGNRMDAAAISSQEALNLGFVGRMLRDASELLKEFGVLQKQFEDCLPHSLQNVKGAMRNMRDLLQEKPAFQVALGLQGLPRDIGYSPDGLGAAGAMGGGSRRVRPSPPLGGAIGPCGGNVQQPLQGQRDFSMRGMQQPHQPNALLEQQMGLPPVWQTQNQQNPLQDHGPPSYPQQLQFPPQQHPQQQMQRQWDQPMQPQSQPWQSRQQPNQLDQQIYSKPHSNQQRWDAPPSQWQQQQQQQHMPPPQQQVRFSQRGQQRDEHPQPAPFDQGFRNEPWQQQQQPQWLGPMGGNDWQQHLQQQSPQQPPWDMNLQQQDQSRQRRRRVDETPWPVELNNNRGPQASQGFPPQQQLQQRQLQPYIPPHRQRQAQMMQQANEPRGPQQKPQQQMQQHQRQQQQRQQQLAQQQQQQMHTVAGDKPQQEDDADALTPEEIVDETSLMICNIPCRITQKQLAAAIDGLGFEGKYDFLYAPRARGGSSPSIGYSFINFKNVEDVPSFIGRMTGYQFEGTISKKKCVVKRARIQGLAGNTEQFPSGRLKRNRWNVPLTSVAEGGDGASGSGGAMHEEGSVSGAEDDGVGAELSMRSAEGIEPMDFNAHSSVLAPSEPPAELAVG